MTREERERVQREVQDSFQRLNGENQKKLLRLAQHLAQHKLISLLYLGDDNPEPNCTCMWLN
jgi:hypothetical protein